jgi:hypothetical protein
MIALRRKPARWDSLGRKIPPPYILDRWCDRCGMPLVLGEHHPREACAVFAASRSYEQALAEARGTAVTQAVTQRAKERQ